MSLVLDQCFHLFVLIVEIYLKNKNKIISNSVPLLWDCSFEFEEFILNTRFNIFLFDRIKNIELRIVDDLANIAGKVVCSGVISSGFMNALYIETTAYGVHEKINIPFG